MLQYSESDVDQGTSPPGWYLPTHYELRSLCVSVQDALKAMVQGGGSGKGTGGSGFSALLGGGRYRSGRFGNLDLYVYFWSSEDFDAGEASRMYSSGDNSHVFVSSYGKSSRCSLRCTRD